MYQAGELIIYGENGVCRVKCVETRDSRRYYVLKPLYQDCMITAPADSAKVFTRPIISREEAERLIGTIPGVRAVAYHSRVLRELSEHYEASIHTHDCADLIRMTMSLYAKKRDMEKQKRRFGAVDERYMRRGEDLLFGELAAALNIPRDEVKDYIAARCGVSADGGSPKE